MLFLFRHWRSQARVEGIGLQNRKNCKTVRYLQKHSQQLLVQTRVHSPQPAHHCALLQSNPHYQEFRPLLQPHHHCSAKAFFTHFFIIISPTIYHQIFWLRSFINAIFKQTHLHLIDLEEQSPQQNITTLFKSYMTVPLCSTLIIKLKNARSWEQLNSQQIIQFFNLLDSLLLKIRCTLNPRSTSAVCTGIKKITLTKIIENVKPSFCCN